MHPGRYLIFLLASLSFTLLSHTAGAESACFSPSRQGTSFPDCLYIGIGAGASQLSPSEGNSSWRVPEKISNSTQIHLGYYIKPRWFTGLSYVDLGTIDLVNRNPAITETIELGYSTLNLSLGYLLFNPENSLNVYGSIGYSNIKLSNRDNRFDARNTQELSLGAGVHWNLSPNWFARIGWDSYSGSVQKAGLSLSYLFGRNHSKPAKAKEPLTASPAPLPLDTKLPQETETIETEIIEKEVIATIAPAEPLNTSDRDSDQDGIADSLDQCNNTPEGASISSSGCAKTLFVPREFNLEIAFASGSSRVPDAALSNIRKLVDFLKLYPYSVVEVAGHTDKLGSDARNLQISQARADEVKQKLVQTFGVDPARVRAIGYGELRPIDTNLTPEGRQRNRRVVAIVMEQR